MSKLKNMLLGILVFVLFACSGKTVYQSQDLIDSAELFAVEFASVDQARKLLTTEDAYTKAWSKFDIESKSKKIGNTRADFIDHISGQALEWTAVEKTRVMAAVARVKESLVKQGFNIHLKQVVSLVKTTSEEEGGAMGYTRGNYIILSQELTSLEDEDLDHLFAHELFHVISRNSPVLREQLYKLIGFQMMNEVPYPEALVDFRITNPDATQTDSYINLTVGDEKVSCMMILYSNRPYDGGSFFNYLNIGFLKLQGDKIKEPVVGPEGPVIYNMQEISGFYEQIGRNTKYIIHPDEILADNFTYAVFKKTELENPELVEAIVEVLKG